MGGDLVSRHSWAALCTSRASWPAVLAPAGVPGYTANLRARPSAPLLLFCSGGNLLPQQSCPPLGARALCMLRRMLGLAVLAVLQLVLGADVPPHAARALQLGNALGPDVAAAAASPAAVELQAAGASGPPPDAPAAGVPPRALPLPRACACAFWGCQLSRLPRLGTLGDACSARLHALHALHARFARSALLCNKSMC